MVKITRWVVLGLTLLVLALSLVAGWGPFLVLAGLIGLGIGAIALIRGHLRALWLPDRRPAGILAGTAAAALVAGIFITEPSVSQTAAPRQTGEISSAPSTLSSSPTGGVVPPPTSVTPTTSTDADTTTSTPTDASSWPDAPKDGTWSNPSTRDISFGSMAQPPAVRNEYSVGISMMPRFDTQDGGKTVTMTSELTVERVTAKWPGKPVADDLKAFWEPGERLAEHRLDESWGTHVRVSCGPSVIQAGQGTVCSLSFTAPAAEIANSFWQVWGTRVGTWPSQKGT